MQFWNRTYKPYIIAIKFLFSTSVWDEDIEVFDAYEKVNFNLRALLFCTINDFLTYGNLSGYSVKGHRACPICEENTSYHKLKQGRKTCYIGHRRFLKRNHLYHRLKKTFNGYQEDRTTPPPLIGEQVITECARSKSLMENPQA